MIRYALVTIAFALTLFTAQRAAAWNSIGHMTVAKIAYDHLDQKRQIALYTLLKNHPHYKDYLSASRPAEIDNEVEWVVLRSAVWSDWVRAKKNDARGININTYHRAEDHYVNIPLIDPKDEKFFAGKTLINPDLPNIVTALKHRANELKMKSASLGDRAIAACWLFHLVGDIHQPLHNSTYFSSDKAFLNGDLGGNRFGIKADGRKWKLHAFWDDVLGVDSDYNDDSAKHQAALFREAVKLAQELRGTKTSDGELEKLEKNRTFESWSREAFELAKTVGYQKSDGSGLLKAVEVPFNGGVPDSAEEVGKPYIDRARATAERQVVLAGKRLADRLTILLTKD